MQAWKALVYTACGSFAIVFPGLVLPAAAQQAAEPQQYAATSGSPVAAHNELAKADEFPDSPGAIRMAEENKANSQNQQSGNNGQSSSQSAQPQAAGSSSQQAPQKPVGTAVAEPPNASGVAAAQPAGVAIAPAKQRRTRTIILRMGAIIGAGAAVGTVVALTAATSSKPPGAH